MILRSAVGLGGLPDLSHDVAWVRVSDAATVLIELLSAPPGTPVLHLVHPHPIPWRMVFGAYASVLGVPLIPASECLQRLALGNVPAARLQAFWGMILQHENGDLTSLEIIDTRKSQVLSPALRNMRPLDAIDFESWLEYWMRAGVMKPKKF